MSITTIGCTFGLAAANPVEIDFATERLQEDHVRLREQLKRLASEAKQMQELQDHGEEMQALRALKINTGAFIAALDRHMEWGNGGAFPFSNGLSSPNIGAVHSTFIWVLENDYQLAMLFIQSFQESAAQAMKQPASPAAEKHIEDARVNLIQACLMLNDHLTMEEQVVSPLTEKVLTDLDYFFS